MTQKIYSLRKSRKILEWSYNWYKKQGENLSEAQLTAFEANLEGCDAAILKGEKARASQLAHELEDFTNVHFKKSPFQYILELLGALALALVIATLVRQVWFELYEIPTGSMRPTFFEQDHLTVSKTQFGINFPLQTKHLYFDPALVQRAGIVIWSGDGVALRDTDSSYFGIFPYKKRYVKRLMGKPGDILYFYGGKIYGMDKDQQLIKELLDSPRLEKLEYIPFLSFQGDALVPVRGTIQFEQMHQAIGKLALNKKGDWIGEVYDHNEWVPDEPTMQKKEHDTIKTYSDFWGIRNFAMARLLTKNELQQYPDFNESELKDGVLYLELAHNPSLTYPKPSIYREGSSISILIKPLTSVIPLQEHHLKAIMDNMYTARFEVLNGRGKRYSVNDSYITASSPYFPHIPNGRYEFYYGKAFSVGWGGITSLLPADHPLYSTAPENVQTLYNMGIDMSLFYQPTPANVFFFPHRYAYFRDGDLYLLGAPILKKGDPVLTDFLEREQKREKMSTESKPYIAFKDYGPPLKEGKIDVEFMKAFGLQIPPKHYLVLGDNHAMSADSRVFGFLPQENLQGVPDLIIWPPGRIGHPNQTPYPLFTLPRLIIWSLAALIGLIWYLIHRHYAKLPVFKKYRDGKIQV
jgi:signal peptidase I